VGLANLVTPVTTAHGDDIELGINDGTANGGGHLLGALDTETAMAIAVADNDEGLEAGALSGTCLLLHGHDLHHLILQLATEEGVDDLVLLDGQREEVDLLQRLYLAALHETSKLGHGHPLASLILVSTAGSTTAPASTITTIATVATAVATTISSTTVSTAEATAKSSTSSTTTTVSHCFYVDCFVCPTATPRCCLKSLL